MTDRVKIERDARVLSITLNRADKKSALTHAMYTAMACMQRRPPAFD